MYGVLVQQCDELYSCSDIGEEEKHESEQELDEKEMLMNNLSFSLPVTSSRKVAVYHITINSYHKLLNEVFLPPPEVFNS